MIQIIWNKIEEIIVVLGYFSPYSSGFGSFPCEMKTDVQGFFRGFQYEIEKILSSWIFRSYSMHIPIATVLNSVVLDLILVIFRC